MAHPLKVGDVLKSTWGYDQTNIDYYQVTALNGKTMVTIQQLEAESIPDPGNFMVGKSRPIKDQFDARSTPRRVKPNDKGEVRLTSYSGAWPCDPNEWSRWTAYA